MRFRTVFFGLALPALQAQPDRFGVPECGGADAEMAARQGFVVCYDFARKLPRWTAHEVKPGPRGQGVLVRRSFRADRGLSRPTAANRDYAGSGWARGHLVPAADVAGDEGAYEDSFLLSNVMAQPAAVNNGVWRRLENAIRRLAEEADAVIVITGTLEKGEAGERFGRGGVVAPTHAFKAVLAVAGAQKRMYAALVRNDAAEAAGSLAEAATTVDELERLTGLDFFAGLEDGEEGRLEAARSILGGGARPERLHRAR